MKKQEILDFIEDKKTERLAPIKEDIKAVRASEFIEWRKPYDHFLDMYDDAMLEFQSTRDIAAHGISDLLGYSQQQNTGIHYAWLDAHPMYRGEVRSDHYIEVEAPAANETEELVHRRTMLKDYFDKEHKAPQDEINLRKQLTNISNEFDAIETNINVIRGAKKQVAFLVSLGFDEDEIMQYSKADNMPALVSVDPSLIFGE